MLRIVSTALQPEVASGGNDYWGVLGRIYIIKGSPLFSHEKIEIIEINDANEK